MLFCLWFYLGNIVIASSIFAIVHALGCLMMDLTPLFSAERFLERRARRERLTQSIVEWEFRIRESGRFAQQRPGCDVWITLAHPLLYFLQPENSLDRCAPLRASWLSPSPCRWSSQTLRSTTPESRARRHKATPKRLENSASVAVRAGRQNWTVWATLECETGGGGGGRSERTWTRTPTTSDWSRRWTTGRKTLLTRKNTQALTKKWSLMNGKRRPTRGRGTRRKRRCSGRSSLMASRRLRIQTGKPSFEADCVSISVAFGSADYLCPHSYRDYNTKKPNTICAFNITLSAKATASRSGRGHQLRHPDFQAKLSVQRRLR